MLAVDDLDHRSLKRNGAGTPIGIGMTIAIALLKPRKAYLSIARLPVDFKSAKLAWRFRASAAAVTDSTNVASALGVCRVPLVVRLSCPQLLASPILAP